MPIERVPVHKVRSAPAIIQSSWIMNLHFELASRASRISRPLITLNCSGGTRSTAITGLKRMCSLKYLVPNTESVQHTQAQTSKAVRSLGGNELDRTIHSSLLKSEHSNSVSSLRGHSPDVLAWRLLAEWTLRVIGIRLPGNHGFSWLKVQHRPGSYCWRRVIRSLSSSPVIPVLAPSSRLRVVRPGLDQIDQVTDRRRDQLGSNLGCQHRFLGFTGL
jgi:hypothetical protein